jgi:putative transposase
MRVRTGRFIWNGEACYHGNALGKADTLITQHALYISIDKIPSERNKVYRDYFKTHINEKQLSEIRVSTQKGWALGSERFKDEVEELTKRRTRPLPRGGRRKQIEVD